MAVRVLIDADGVLCNWLDGVLDLIFEVSGKRLQRQEITSWDPWSQAKLTTKQRSQVFSEMEAPGWHESLAAMPGAREAFTSLCDIADVYVVSSPWESCPTWTHERRRWLANHFGVASDHFIATSAKHVVSGDFFIDDHAVNVRKWLEHNSGVGLLLDTSYNRGVELPRVHSWQELLDIVGEGHIAA